MAKTLDASDAEALRIRMRPPMELSDDQLLEFCALNGDLRIERTAEGDLLIMPPAGAESGRQEIAVASQLYTWALRDGTGVAFGPTAGFVLPDRAMRAPDASWVRRERLVAFTTEQKKKFLPVCPDVVIEVRSTSDSRRVLEGKMREYVNNGARLGWLIDPAARRVDVYRPGRAIETLEGPESLSGDPELPGFTLDLRPVWEPDL